MTDRVPAERLYQWIDVEYVFGEQVTFWGIHGLLVTLGMFWAKRLHSIAVAGSWCSTEVGQRTSNRPVRYSSQLGKAASGTIRGQKGVLPGWHPLASTRPLLVFRRVGLPAESTSYRSGYTEHTRGQQYGWFRPNTSHVLPAAEHECLNP